MADRPANIAASVKQRLLNMARAQGRAFDILLVRFTLERLLFRLSKSPYRERYILKGGMLVTQWLDHDNRETRDIDFLGFGASDPDALQAIFAEIKSIDGEDGIRFDTDALVASVTREETEYGGIRLRTTAYLERTQIPVTLDIGFGDALASVNESIEDPSLLGMERPCIRSYPSASVMAENFQAVVALGLANGRMKDFYDLWIVPKALAIDDNTLDVAIAATFERRTTPVPRERPAGLSETMAQDPSAQRRWWVYTESLELPAINLMEVLDDVWELLAPSCMRLSAR